MDTKAFINNLRAVFEDLNEKLGGKYTQVWLTRLNYGGLYYSSDYALSLKLNHNIERYLTEVKEVSALLREKAGEESKFIVRINVFGVEEKAEPESDDFIILEKETALP